MPVVPRMSEQKSIAAVPDVRLSGMDKYALQASSKLGDAVHDFGKTVQREGLAFGAAAIQKQEEIDRLELAKIKASRDAEVAKVLTEEDRSPDYATLNKRVTDRMATYDADLAKSVNGRVKRHVDNLIAHDNALLVPTVQKMFLKKQDDVAMSTFLQAQKQFEENGDFDSSIASIDALTGISEAQRAKLRIDTEKRKKDHEMTAKAEVMGPELYEKSGGSLGKSLEMIRGMGLSAEDEKYYAAQYKRYYSETKAVENEAQNELFSKLYDEMRSGASWAAMDRKLDASKSGLGEDLYWRMKDANDREHEHGKFAPKGDGSGGTNVFAWIEAKEALESGQYTDPNDFAKAYVGKLKGYEVRSLVNSYFYRNEGKGGSKRDKYNGFNPMDYVKKRRSDMGVDADINEDKAFWAMFSESVAAKKEECRKKGVQFSDDDVIKICDDQLTKDVIHRGYGWVGQRLVSRIPSMKDESSRFYVKPSKEDKAYRYQIKYAKKYLGVREDANTGQLYTVDPETGRLMGWAPDSTPKEKPKGKQRYPVEDEE